MSKTLKRVISNIQHYPKEVRQNITSKILQNYQELPTTTREILAKLFFQDYSYPPAWETDTSGLEEAEKIAELGSLQEEKRRVTEAMKMAQERCDKFYTKLLEEDVEKNEFFHSAYYAFQLNKEKLATEYFTKGVKQLLKTTLQTFKTTSERYRNEEYYKWLKYQLDALIYYGSIYFDKLSTDLLTTISKFVSKDPEAKSIFRSEFVSNTEGSRVFHNYRAARFCAYCLGETKVAQLYADLLLLNLDKE